MNTPLRVLVIEADAATRKYLVATMSEMGFDVLDAPGAEAGISLLKPGKPDMVLVPLEAAQGVLAAAAQVKRDTPAIVTLGPDEMQSATEAIKLGATDYSSKAPADQAVLEHTVRKAWEHETLVREVRQRQQQIEEHVQERTAALGQELDTLRRSEDEQKRHVEGLQKAMVGTVNAMAMTVEIRDPYTAGHQRLVSSLARDIGEELGLTSDQIEGLSLAGLIHDLGKIGVPAEILSKPGRLTDIEFALIKTHSEVGYDIIKEVEFPWPVAQIVFQHHERIDGSGYPRGLTAEEIIIEARIICVADVLEAMYSHRPYRAALGIEVAHSEITDNAGKIYDPDVVKACQKLFDKWF